MTRTTRTFNKISYNEAEFFFDILQHIKIITILWVVFLLASFAIFIGKRKQILFKVQYTESSVCIFCEFSAIFLIQKKVLRPVE